jgi:predicted SnoaL-like aldol condensation-catalyzing enzyme
MQNRTMLATCGWRVFRTVTLAQAATKYTGRRYTRHVSDVGDGEGFVGFLEPFLQRCPVRDIRVKHAAVDGRFVFVQVENVAECMKADERPK